MAELWLGAEAVVENTISDYAASRSVVPGERLTSAEDLVPVERWYAVSVRPRHEKLATRHFESQGLHHFLPVYRSVRRWKDRRKELDMVLFPGYVFVNLNLRDRLGVLRARRPAIRELSGPARRGSGFRDPGACVEPVRGPAAAPSSLPAPRRESPGKARASGGRGRNHDPPQRTLPLGALDRSDHAIGDVRGG